MFKKYTVDPHLVKMGIMTRARLYGRNNSKMRSEDTLGLFCRNHIYKIYIYRYRYRYIDIYRYRYRYMEMRIHFSFEKDVRHG